MSQPLPVPMTRPRRPSFLLVGPYDPGCGEYTFVSPPLGVWRLAGGLEAAGFPAEVFDPNNTGGGPERALARALAGRRWSVIGFSLTGMTLRHDLALAHLARRIWPDAVLVAGGMEATFNPEQVMRLGPFDLCVLGEGERPLRELARRLGAGADLSGIPGTCFLDEGGSLVRLPQAALDHDELRAAIFATPYERMPYRSYWSRLEERYRVGALPVKADREARLAELRAVRLITLNYCPMACTFCSSTNFLTAAQGSTAKLARLDAEECLTMLRRIAGAYPDLRTLIFQDDIFVFNADQRILPLCEGIVAAKKRGELPEDLRFISTNRIDAMTEERLRAMRRAGFQVLGFGIENFSRSVLAEFNKAQIHRHIEPVLRTALDLGITPFLDLILSSPRCSLADLAANVREAFRWIQAGCEVGTYPYVIPFSGAAMATDPALRPHTIYERHEVAGTLLSYDKAAKIPPIDARARSAILAIERDFEARLADLEQRVAHLPSRVRSLLWIASAVPVLAAEGEAMPAPEAIESCLQRALPRSEPIEEEAEWSLLEPAALAAPGTRM